MIARRGFITGALALLAAPVVVRAEGLMKVAPTSVILPEHRFDTRILVDYDITTDSALLRVDRKLGKLIRPPRVVEASLEYAKAKLGANHPIFDVQPGPGQQKYAMVRLGDGMHDYTRWAAAFSEPADNLVLGVREV
jgi:hypothetical protein